MNILYDLFVGIGLIITICIEKLSLLFCFPVTYCNLF